MNFKMEVEFFYNGQVDGESMRRAVELAVYRITLVHDAKVTLLQADENEGK